jgi:multiple sugar transport system substrate-binding protein
MRHRGRIRLLAAVAALSLIAGCGGSDPSDETPSGDEKVSLTFWSWVPNISKSVDLWNSRNPNIQVELNEVPGGSQGTYTKMYAAVKAGNAPDIGQIEYGFLPNFAQLGNLVDIAGYLDPAVRKDFPDWTWTQVSSGAAVYAVPQDIAPEAFFYRKDIFDAAGITKAPATWAEFESAAAAIHKKNPKQYIANFPTNQGDWFTGLVWQAGGKWFGNAGDKWSVSVTDPASLKVADYWQDLIDRDLVKASGFWSDQWNKELQDGTLAGWVVGAWGGPNLEKAAPKTAGKWAVAPLPQWEAGARSTGNWGGSTTAVMKGSQHPEQAVKFMEWLNHDPESVSILGKEGGLYCAATTWQSSDSFKASSTFFGGQQIYPLIAQQTLEPSWQWGPTMSDTFATFQDATGKMEAGQGTIRQALETTQSRTVATLKSEGFPVADG